MVKRKPLEIRQPGIIDGILTIILAIWIITVFVILNRTLPLTDIYIGLSSITAFSVLFCSIVLIMIAIILEDIRKKL